VPRAGRTVLGGTFDHLHIGHESLLETAFRTGRPVAIGLTSERYLSDHPKPGRGVLQSYATRRRRLVSWLRANHPKEPWTVVPIDDRFGGSVAPGVAVLVVSADTVAGGRAVNAERGRRGLPPARLVVVPLALADDLRPVASRRIRAGTIDRDGRRRSRIRVGLWVSDPRDRPTAARAIRSAFPGAVVVPVPDRSGSSRPSRTHRSTESPDAPEELTLGIRRRRAGGWEVVERTAGVTLLPVRVRGSRPSDLARGLRSLLRPSSGPGPRESF
jgi:pantetheine-phosphate adenylyltransferase